jgi:DNA-binding transcriptional LysR family regulator
MRRRYAVAQTCGRRQNPDTTFQKWNTMNLNALLGFTLVASNEGLGKASRVSGISKATLSRHVSELEEQMGVRLVERSARGLKLTEAGQLLMARTEGPLGEVAEAMTAAREGVSTPRGRLRIASPILFSQLAMGRIGAEFCAAYPEVVIEVVSEDRMVDLVEEQFDVAIRVNPSPDSSLVGRCFAKDRLVVVAAPEIPKPLPGAIRQVPGIVSSGSQPTRWNLDGGQLVLEPIPRLRFSSFLMIRDAAIAGGGAALIPQSIAWDQLSRGELVQWGTASDVEAVGPAYVKASCHAQGARVRGFHVRSLSGHVPGPERIEGRQQCGRRAARLFRCDLAVKHGMQMRAVHDACRRYRLALPWNVPEVPIAPEGLVGVRVARQQGRKGFDFAHFDAARFAQHFMHEARTELAPRVEVEAGVVKDTHACLCRLDQGLPLLCRQRSIKAAYFHTTAFGTRQETSKAAALDTGKVLSAMTGSAPPVATTTPTWLVQLFVVEATFWKGRADTRMKSRSPTSNCRANAGLEIDGSSVEAEALSASKPRARTAAMPRQCAP